MIKFNNTAVMNFENAMRGARNPLNSWARSDSSYDENGNFVFGLNDLDLAKRLCQAGNDHRKFIRQIFISGRYNCTYLLVERVRYIQGRYSGKFDEYHA